MKFTAQISYTKITFLDLHYQINVGMYVCMYVCMYIFSIWNIHKHQVTQFIELANKHHQTIKFTAQISYTKITFLDLNVFKGERFAEKSILDIEHFSIRISQAANPLGIKKGFIKGEALRLLRTNSSENELKTKISLPR